MSTENFESLIRSAQHDRVLTEQLRSAPDLGQLVQIGAARGYQFTADELMRYFRDLEAGELSEAELGLVSGGSDRMTSEGATVRQRVERCFVKSWSTSGDAD